MKTLLFYADPGSGMMLLQVLLAFGAGILFYFRKFFSRLFGRDKTPKNLPEAKENVSAAAVAPAAPNSENEV